MLRKGQQKIGRIGIRNKVFSVSIEPPKSRYGLNHVSWRISICGVLYKEKTMKDLTLEQSFIINKLSIEIHSYNREELIAALLECWEARFRQKQAFLDSAKEAGFNFRLNEGIALIPGTLVDEFEEEHGYVPSPDEAEAYMQDIYEEANMELDMDAIVLESEE
tara:strand:- start:860 stop:1348 length:489 start_codon:yes stop_codon:yes gene_type:complete